MIACVTVAKTSAKHIFNVSLYAWRAVRVARIVSAVVVNEHTVHKTYRQI